MTALLLKLSPYFFAVAVIFAGGWYAGGLQPKAALARLQAADWQSKALAEQASRKAIQAQMELVHEVAERNARTAEELNAQNIQIAADRDRNVELARRLLLSAHRPAAPGHPVPQAADHASPTSTGQSGPPPDVASLLGDAATGYERCVSQLNALIGEIRPQL